MRSRAWKTRGRLCECWQAGAELSRVFDCVGRPHVRLTRQGARTLAVLRNLFLQSIQGIEGLLATNVMQ